MRKPRKDRAEVTSQDDSDFDFEIHGEKMRVTMVEWLEQAYPLNGGMAEDAVQETFLAFHKTQHTLRSTTVKSVRSWFFTTTRRNYINLIGKYRRGNYTDVSRLPISEDDSAVTIIKNLADRELCQKIMEEEESSTKIKILELRYAQEMTHAEIAQSLGIPKGAVDRAIKDALDFARWKFSNLGS